jgi:RNA polymerase sigma-70 factor (ECF subfamily)
MRDSPGSSPERLDHELVDGIRRGNLRDFSLLVDRYQDRAFTLAARVLGDPASAEEAVQDAFLKAYRGIATFRGDAAFGTWFYRIVYNCCLTRARRRTPERTSLDDEDAAEPVSEDPGADQRLEEQETAALVNEILGELPAPWRAVVTLFYIEELKYEQIAEILGIPLGTVKTHLFRARARMKKLIAERFSVAEEHR